MDTRSSRDGSFRWWTTLREDVLASIGLSSCCRTGLLRFFGQDLKPLELEFFDPETWKKYGWGRSATRSLLAKLKDAENSQLKNKKIKPKA